MTYRILIVDDNASIHDDFRKTFWDCDDREFAALESELFGEDAAAAPAEEYALAFAFQGHDALRMVETAVAAEQPFEVAFVDVRMPPGWDGIETIKRLWHVQPALEVVLCTAYSDYSWRRISKDWGARISC